MTVFLQLAAQSILSLLKTWKKFIPKNLAFRQQFTVSNRSLKNPQLTPSNRMFWVLLSRISIQWSETLFLVQTETVVRFPRQGYRFYWTRKSHVQRFGRPSLDPAAKDLI